MKQVLLLGVGNFGFLLAKELNKLGHEVMAVDVDENKVNNVLPYVTNAQIGDSTNPAFLSSLGINNYDVCIVSMGSDFQSSLETTSLLKEMGAKFVVARADREVQAKFLLRNGADEVVNPESQMARWTSLRYTKDNILDFILLDDDHSIIEVAVPEEWQGKTIGEIDIRKKHGINILAVKENGKMNFSITADCVLKGTNTLYVLGESKALHKCFRV